MREGLCLKESARDRLGGLFVWPVASFEPFLVGPAEPFLVGAAIVGRRPP